MKWTRPPTLNKVKVAPIPLRGTKTACRLRPYSHCFSVVVRPDSPACCISRNQSWCWRDEVKELGAQPASKKRSPSPCESMPSLVKPSHQVLRGSHITVHVLNFTPDVVLRSKPFRKSPAASTPGRCSTRTVTTLPTLIKQACIRT